MSSNIQYYVFGLFILIGVVGTFAYADFTRNLREHAAPEWQRLGRPTLFSRKSIRDEITFLFFILRRRYSTIENKKLNFLGNVLFGCLLTAWAAFLLLIIYGSSGGNG
jgi:hypothetical protein